MPQFPKKRENRDPAACTREGDHYEKDAVFLVFREEEASVRLASNHSGKERGEGRTPL